MSYDISVFDKRYKERAQRFNYTYNLSKFFHTHLIDSDNEENTGLQILNGKTGNQAYFILKDALHRIEATRERLHVRNEIGEATFCLEYDSSNGWGSTVGAIMLISLLLVACVDQPEAIISIS